MWFSINFKAANFSNPIFRDPTLNGEKRILIKRMNFFNRKGKHVYYELWSNEEKNNT